MAKERSLVAALHEYWKREVEYEKSMRVSYDYRRTEKKEALDQAATAVRPFSEQEAESFSFRYWYLIHLVFRDDIAVYRKMLARAEAPHEKLYVLVVGVVYVDTHFGRQWSRNELNEFHDSILSPWIENFRKTMEPMMNAREYDRVSRLVRNSTKNRGIEHCAYAWILGSTEGMELHRYPVR